MRRYWPVVKQDEIWPASYTPIQETGLYYLQSRYYNPTWGRFINADAFVSTGQGILGNNMFAYCNNNPAIYKDSGGQYVESALDVVSIGLDIADIAANPTNILSWGALAADIACLLLPGATGGGSIVRVVVSYDKLSDVLKYGDDIIDAGKAIVSSLENGRNMHSLYRPVIESADTFLNKALKSAFDDLDSLLRPDGINKISQTVYELKPCNLKSLKQAVNQVKKYIEMFDEAKEWLAIIDLYF